MEARTDLKVWATFIKDYNGRTMLTDQLFVSSNTLQLTLQVPKGLHACLKAHGQMGHFQVMLGSYIFRF